MRPLALALILAGAIYAADITGVVRDSSGQPIDGATVTVLTKAHSQVAQATTGNDGAYRLSVTADGDYDLTAEAPGRFAPLTKPLQIPAAPGSGTVDFSLLPAKAAPQFQAAGVRGLIDPGGYSAPAQASAASGVVSGIADLQRTNSGSQTPVTPCDREPELLQAVQSDPGSTAANRDLGRFYLVHGDAAKAIPLLERAGEERDLAAALLDARRFDEARKLLITESPQPDDAATHRLLARADEGSGLFAEAADEYRRAAQIGDDEADLFGVGYELILDGKAADAARAFQSGLESHPASATLLIGMGAARFLQNQPGESVRYLLQAADLSPSDPRPYPFLANALTGSGVEPDKVAAAFRRYRELAPSNAEANYFYALGLIHERKSGQAWDGAEAERSLRRATELDPNLAAAHFELAALLAEKGDNAEAEREYEACLRAEPERAEAHYRLAAIYRKTGNKEGAARELALFRQTRDADAKAAGGMSIDIERFVSVLNRHPAPAAAGSCEVMPH